MARALDAGSDDAFTGRTSELRGKETDPQPDRVGFKQFFNNMNKANYYNFCLGFLFY